MSMDRSRRSGRSGTGSRTRRSRSTICGSIGRTSPRPGTPSTIRVDVTNTGARAGDEVVQLYVRDEEASVARPVRELRGFRRVRLEAGECRTIAFTLSTEQFAYVDAGYHRVVEPGRVSVQVGRSSTDLPLTAVLTLVGPVVELVERRDYLTRTAIE